MKSKTTRAGVGAIMAILVGLGWEGPSALAADEPVVTVTDAAAAKVQSPVLVSVSLGEDLVKAAKENRLCVVEALGEGKTGPTMPAQFTSTEQPSAAGLLGFFAPPGGAGERRFRVVIAAKPPAAQEMEAGDEAGKPWTLSDGDKPIVCYNYATVPVPAGVGGRYAVARSNYVHPLIGPGGEVLTYDYSKDHPHHRGLYWAWPETYWKGQVRDLHALQGCFARPVKMHEGESGPVWSALTAENRWMWDDKQPIVHERATIRAFAQSGGRRCIDFEFTFTALEDGVQIATRGQKAYGGFNCRFSARAGQKIMTVEDKPDAAPRVSAAQIVGTPPEGKGPIAVAILQHASNPCYPGAWVSYPNLNWLQPTFPTNGTKYALEKGKPLTLRYRLVVQSGEIDEPTLRTLWAAYNQPG